MEQNKDYIGSEANVKTDKYLQRQGWTQRGKLHLIHWLGGPGLVVKPGSLKFTDKYVLPQPVAYDILSVGETSTSYYSEDHAKLIKYQTV